MFDKKYITRKIKKEIPPYIQFILYGMLEKRKTQFN